MRKLPVVLLFSLLIILCFTVSALFAVENLAPVGSKVKVITLDHQNDFFAGKNVPKIKGKIIRYEHRGWSLYSEKLKEIKKQSDVLPPGYVEWDVLAGQEWPRGHRVGVPMKTPVIQLDNGTTVTGDQCWWELADKKLNERMVAALETRLVKLISAKMECEFRDHPEKLGLSTAAEVEQFLKNHPHFFEQRSRDLLNLLQK